MEFSLERSIDHPDNLAEEWNSLLAESSIHVPFLRHEYLSAWWETRGGGEWKQGEPAVVLARQDGRLEGIAPLFSAKNRDGEDALLLLGSIEISDYLDLIARPESLPAFISGLLDFLAGLETGNETGSNRADEPAWKVLDLHNIPEWSPSLAILAAEAGRRGWNYTQEATYHAPCIPLTGDFETYLAGIDKKQRHEIRRKLRRMEDCGRQVRWYMASDSDSLADEVESFLTLMAGETEKADFLTPPMRRQMQLTCRAAFDNGWLQLAFLEVDGQKAAGYLNFDYLNRIWVYNSGIDRQFLDLSPGWVLLGYLLRWANENKRLEFDFMRGNEDYKYRFGARDQLVVRAKVSR